MNDFLHHFQTVLPQNSLERMYTLRDMLERQKNVALVSSKHGPHYKNCIWSNSNAMEGPDTCICTMIQLGMDEAKQIMTNFYQMSSRSVALSQQSLSTKPC